MKKERYELKNIRFNKLYLLIGLFLFGVIIYRIGTLSLSKEVENVDLQSMANNRTTRRETLYSKRGTIYDVNGNPLAQSVSSYTLIAYLSESRTTDPKKPKHVVDKERTAKELSEVLGVSEEQLLKYLSRENVYQVELGPGTKNLTELKKDEIKALGLPGIDFIETQQRFYPNGQFASYIIGYARKKEVTYEDGNTEEKMVGEMGIESFYNDILTGSNGFTLYQKDRQGYKIAGTQEVTVPAQDGYDVYLTINSNVQLFVEDAIQEMNRVCKSDSISLMVADAKTGAILASGTYPTFDPNVKDIKSYLNPNIQVAFEPGSTMKIFSYMAAMENGTYNGDEKYKSGIFVAKDGTEIGDWHRQGWGYITYDQGFAISSNTAVMNLVDKYMSAEILRNYYKKLGFGSKTGIELYGEASGKLNFRYQTEILNAAFGQGITTTAIQNIKALTAISNDGILLQPYIVDKVVNPDTGEVVYQGGKKEIERVASIKTVNKMRELMRSVITGNSNNSTGYYYYMDGYDFIAKTGTAQVASENGKGYTGGIVRGLAGMFPGNDPKVLIYMAVKNPSCGSSTKPFKNFIQSIIKNTSKYLEIYDESKQNITKLEEFKMGSYLNKDVNSVVQNLKTKSLNVVVIGNGNTVINQYPMAGVEVNKIDKVFLLTDGEVTIPDFKGYSVKDFKTYAKLINLNYKVDGLGYCASQSIQPGEKVKEDTLLEVKFEAKY